jgi:hypothetical protein
VEEGGRRATGNIAATSKAIPRPFQLFMKGEEMIGE